MGDGHNIGCILIIKYHHHPYVEKKIHQARAKMQKLRQVIFLIAAFQVLDVIGFSILAITKPKLNRQTASTTTSSMSTSSIVESDMGVVTLSQKSFDAALWAEYESVITNVIANLQHKGKKRKHTDFSSSIQYLMSKQPVLDIPNVNDQNFGWKVMENQREMFLVKTNLTMTEHHYAMKAVTYMGHYCAKEQNAALLTIAWHKILESGMTPKQQAISTYMYTLSLNEETAHLSGEVATYYDAFFDSDETSISIRIKSLMSDQDAAGAEKLLNTLPRTKCARLRTYQPILYHYCDKVDLNSAIRLYRQMRQAPAVHFDADTYAVLIGAIAENGTFRQDADPLEVARQVGFGNTHGPKLFDELVQEMADDIVEITNSSAAILHNAFLAGFRDSLSSVEDVMNASDMITRTQHAEADEVILNRVTVNATSGVCPCSRVSLKLYKLDEKQRENLCGALFKMAKDGREEHYKKMLERKTRAKKKLPTEKFNSSFAVDELESFCDWIQSQGPFTAIVDGPNVLYHGQGEVHFSQLKKVIEKLEEMNEKPLILMPYKYVQSKINLRYDYVQKLDEKSLEFLERLKQEYAGMLYIVPTGCLDDYYWMIASVVGDKLSDVDADESPERFPGCRPMLISNDQMRDHKLELLEPRQFRRWYSCHIVNYDFSRAPLDDEWGSSRKVHVFAADVYSNEIQGNPFNDNAEDTGSLVWHLPVREWDKHDKLCIRIV